MIRKPLSSVAELRDNALAQRRFRLSFLYAVPIGALGGLIGLGGAEFRLPVLAGTLGYPVRQAVPLNLAVSLITIVASLAIRGKTSDPKKGFQASLLKGNYQKNVGFQGPSFQGGANPKSKIQNPKSGDSFFSSITSASSLEKINL